MNNKLMLRDEEEPPGTKGSSNSSRDSEDSGEVPLAHDRHSVRPSRRINRQESNRHVSPSTSNRDETSLEDAAVKASRAFRRRMFPNASVRDWNDWTWQIANRVTTLHQLESMLELSHDERAALAAHGRALPMAITPYYASLLDPGNPNQAIRRSMVPTVLERTFSSGEDEDPLAEEHDTPVPGLVHRYPDRVLFLATDNCSAYCRYCTRSRMVGQRGSFSIEQWERALAYIEEHREIRDVLVSGGDPLTLPDDVLDWLLGRIRAIRHVEFIRIGTKVPAVLPMRITPNLVRTLRKYHPLWISIHATHPAELTPEMRAACNRLADGGFPLGSQTVLLAGINDNVETMKALFHGLLTMRVRPYYLYQCDPIPGSAHFRTPVEKGLEIIRGLRGHTTGYAVPNYVIDAPGGGGKIPLLPDYVVGYEGDQLVLSNYKGERYTYPDTQSNRADRTALNAEYFVVPVSELLPLG
ncbi:MAG TPA: KamA family radical SAM protein [Spirochaetia bacterium]|nr:KamA family radical SAM protein [Spirochaetia bacterium]